MNQLTVLILSDDPDFSRSIMSRWQREASVPAFTVVGSAWQGTSGEYDAALVGPLGLERLFPILAALEVAWSVRPSICACPDAVALQQVRERFPRVLALAPSEGWIDALVVLASEVLRRVEAGARARRAEQVAADSRRHAALGRYMLDMRHGLNNALTSVLGNAELLLLEPSSLSSDVRDQIDTIHSMGLRMHEILQRFSSLEAEMQFAEKQSHPETKVRAASYAAGS